MPEDVAGFGDDVSRRLQSSLGARFVGAYFVGSVALGGFVPNESDVDIVAVCDGRLSDASKTAVADEILEATDRCPARGLEFTLYRREIVGAPPIGADFEVNANGGPRMDRSVHLDAASEPWFWYVLDRAIAFRCGRRIAGPPTTAIFADVARGTLLTAMVESMGWHRRHEGATLYSVLNAARAWRFAEDGVLGSKLEGAAWARQRWSSPTVIDAAVELRYGRPADLDPQDVGELLEHVEHALVAAPSEPRDP